MKKQIIVSIFMLIAASGAVFAQSVVKSSGSRDLFDVLHNRKAVKKMLSRGVAVNARNAQGKTALDLVVEAGDIKIARDLVRYGARVTTEINLIILKDFFKVRAIKFFVVGWLFQPWLWFGSIASLNKLSKVRIMAQV